jgi:hypothetical protein
VDPVVELLVTAPPFSTTAIFPPIPRTMLVGIGSVQPFQDWSWSIVAKVAVMLVAGK